MILQLPPVDIGGKRVRLPCPESDLIRLSATWSELLHDDGSDGKARQQTAQLLRSAPTLFLFGLAIYSERKPEAPFLEWVQSCLRSEFGNGQSLPVCNEELKPRRLVRAIRGLATSRKPVSYVEGLGRLMSSFRLKLGRNRRLSFFQSVSLKKQVRELLANSKPVAADTLLDRWLHHQLDLDSLFAPFDYLAEQKMSEEQRLREEKLLAMKQLAYGASHEINNPLANIATRAQTLLAVETHPHRRQKLAVIYEQAMRAHEMISDLMLFGHPGKPQFDSICVQDLVGQVLREFGSVFKERKIRSHVVRYPGLPKIEADSNLVAEAVKAVLRNAMESVTATESLTSNASATRPSIQVRMWPESESMVVLGISDNGPGISADAKKHLFDPFYSGREAGRGLGFGLSKAWTIVRRLHGGDVEWFDRTGESTFRTEFRIRLPVQQAVQPEVDKRKHKPAA